MSGVCVTGVGLLTPLGDGSAAVAEALCAGRTALAPAPELEGAAQARIADFDANRYAKIRGMRLYNRATQLGICATKLALADAGLETSPLPPEQLGLVEASTLSHLDTLVEYDRSLVVNGIQRSNHSLMALSIPSAPGALTALAFATKAFSLTVGDWGTGSLDALGVGMRLVLGGRARACVVVSAASPCKELALSAARAGLFARDGAVRVFDREAKGTAWGEAAAAVVLERPEDARARGASVKVWLRAQASAFAARPEARAQALTRAAAAALRAAGVAPASVTLASSGADGTPEADRAEAQALVAALGSDAPAPVMAVKSGLGDCLDTSGLLQVLLAAEALRSARAPGVAGLVTPQVSGLRYASKGTAVHRGSALTTATSGTGSCSALVLSVDDAA